MRRSTCCIVLLSAVGTARAGELATSADDSGANAAPADLGEHALGASLGASAGFGGWTPGGARVEAHYLYQLTDSNWFDATAGFSIGGGGNACSYDASMSYICHHGAVQGDLLELATDVRHFIAGSGDVWPFLFAGAGIGIPYFPHDVVMTSTDSRTIVMPPTTTGLWGVSLWLRGGGGVRITMGRSTAFVGRIGGLFGFGNYQSAKTAVLQLGVTATAGVEVSL